jgi:hypothetical protein
MENFRPVENFREPGRENGQSPFDGPRDRVCGGSQETTTPFNKLTDRADVAAPAPAPPAPHHPVPAA